MRTSVVTVAALATLTAVGCSAPGEAPEPSPQQVQDLFTQWNDALATGNPETVADLYAPDAVLLPTVSDEIRTDRAGIVAYFTDFLPSRPSAVIEQSVVDVLDADHAVDTGVYRFTLDKPGGVETVDARYTFVYEKQGGDWLIVNHHSSAVPES